jgi:hypothetical protein
VVRSVVKEKWRHYRLWFVVWGVIHVMFMALLTAYAIFKARVIADNIAVKEYNASAGQPPPQGPDSMQKAFVTVTNNFFFI